MNEVCRTPTGNPTASVRAPERGAYARTGAAEPAVGHIPPVAHAGVWESPWQLASPDGAACITAAAALW